MSKDCCGSQSNKKLKKRGVDSFLVGVIVLTVVTLAGVFYFGSKLGATPEVETQEQIDFEVDSNTYDWGRIDMDKGIVSKTFKIENKSDVPLKLYDVKTSCTCTTAQLKSKDRLTKKYGMHEKTTNLFEIKPKETAELIVEFDPAFHGPSAVGPISRVVTMNTNDASNPTLTFNLTGDVFKN